MRHLVSALALLLPAALAGAGGALAADPAAGTCSDATLRGTYLFSYQGTVVAGKGQGTFAYAGIDVYDGRGHVTDVSTSSTNGTIARLVRSSAKYTVNADCTGTVTYSDGSTYDQFVAPDGSSLVFVETDRGTVATGVERSVTARRAGG